MTFRPDSTRTPGPAAGHTGPPAALPGAAEAVAATRKALVRLMVALLVPVLALLAVLTALQYQQRIEDAERDLLRRADERAQELEAVALPAMQHVADLRELFEARWHDPPDGGPALARALTASLAAGQPDGWTLDDADAATRQRLGQFWWAPADGRPPEAVWLHRARAFIDQARTVHQRSPGFVATWFAAADVNTSFGYPWVRTDAMLGAMGQPTLQAIDGPRRTAADRSRAQLARDPGQLTFWGPPSVSQLDGELVMSHGVSVLIDGSYVGEISLDFRLRDLQQRVERWRDADSRVWVVDPRMDVLADSREPLLPPPGARADTRMQHPLAARLPRGVDAADLDGSLFTPGTTRHAGGWVIVSALRIGSPWTYVQAVPESSLRAQVLPTLLPNALLGAALLALFVAAPWLLARRFVTPALAVLAYMQALAQAPGTAAPRLGPRWQAWVNAVTGVFERQRTAQQRERQTEALKAAIIDYAINGIVSTDAQGLILEFNPAAEAMFGRTRADVLGRAVGEVIVPPRLRADHAAGMARMAAGGQPRVMGRRVQMPALRADGSEFPVEMVLFRTELDGVVHYTASLSDITERERAAAQIERQRDALRQSEKLTAMGSLLAGVAHELNNPLAIVMGRASLLEDKTEGTPLAADAQHIREAAERCGRIVRTFLNMARQKPAERRAVQVNDLARAAAEMLGYTLRSHGVVLTLQLTDALPEVQADADQLGQVVLNLIVNAQQATAGVGDDRRIVVATGVEPRRDARPPRVWLRVADSGPGVPQAVRDRIFDPFFTTKPEGSGTGLGLSVSRSIVNDHGGNLVLETARPLGGASFRLSLPITGQAEGATSTVSSEEADDPAAGRVLVVDDEPEIADMMRAMLEGAGYEVAVAESGAVALELLQAATFDAVVSDLRMPDIDGAALWREARRLDPALSRRMLFVSGDTLSPGAGAFLGESGCDCIDKPFRRDELLERVARLVDRDPAASRGEDAHNT